MCVEYSGKQTDQRNSLDLSNYFENKHIHHSCILVSGLNKVKLQHSIENKATTV